MFDYSNLFTTAHSGVSGMSFDIGIAFTGLIVILLVVQGLEILIDVLLNRKSERDEYEQWKANKEKYARFRATYESETNSHGPSAPKRPYTSNYL
ncbi:hypothetical protein [Trichlorobacter ammonificans]|uniref:Uncharacterized protein n=1 Tax=Trichlorobacter ammonificans TaxID=2916410 RepID=A0ABM9DA77_9BACT|nr:hypothetical protein [Trichlorobacter ammonificans]CAH2032103.1 protein of unknown function [Trichlorobacter ammonificans]